VGRAAKAGVTVLALSDHDSISGLPEAFAAAQGGSMKVAAAVEINTCRGENVHVLGYGMRWQDAGFGQRLEEYRGRRVERVHRIIAALRGLGVELDFSDVKGSGSLGRGHVAEALRRKGLVPNKAEAFRRFLAAGRPAYVESLGPDPAEAIALIREAGGFAVAAHPGTIVAGEIEDWIRAGLEGIEVYYAAHGPSDVARYRDMADRLGLIATGGTDYHGRGSGRDGPLGVEVEESVAARFLDRLAKCG
jgi:predicted metal-dependent phosphoesterase TrpH